MRRLWSVVRAEHEAGTDPRAVALAAIQVAACALLASRDEVCPDNWVAIWEVARSCAPHAVLEALRGKPVFFTGE